MRETLVVAQLGAPTAVINQTLVGLVEEARCAGFGRVLGSRNGVLGLLRDEMFDLSAEPPEVLAGVRTTPGAALGSCRYNLRREGGAEDFARIARTLSRHEVAGLVFIGGNGTMAALREVARVSEAHGHAVRVVGAPKTIDNDMFGTDHTPGYGSVAKYVATVVQEAGRDTESLATFDTCTVIETMGRDSGWIAAAAGLAHRTEEDAPHIILAPELPVSWKRLGEQVRRTVDRVGRCVVVAGEGLRNEQGEFLAPQTVDPSGQMQFGGVAEVLRNFIQGDLKYKCRYNKPGTAQRNGAHVASRCDAEEADAVGREAARALAAGETLKMVSIRRRDGQPYAVSLGLVDLDEAAGRQRVLPREFLDEEGTAISEAFRRYLQPLVQGRVEVAETSDGVPQCVRLTRRV
ncbi:MAG: diphosphate--fructose-6-phosphate 1-phosphotransferase [Planctomycetes bacterium]|nr:diphosphate--fructose-6-phosphate 1-phosphotransferase [Planctomycetota bacterium]